MTKLICPHCGNPTTTKHDQPYESLRDDQEFIVSMCRYSEGLYTEARIRKRYGLADEVWERLGADEALIERIEEEKIARRRAGTSVREKAQLRVTKSPDILDTLMCDNNTPPRSRIESARELRALAAVGPEATPAAERFSIVINLGEDHKLIKIDKPIRPGPDDDEVIDQKLLPMIAANKREDGGNGNPL